MARGIAMICPQCGTPSREGDRFCEECGATLATPGERSSSATQMGAAIEASSRLVPLEGNGQSAYDLGNRAVVGRLDTCDLPINDRSVSREHARLSRLRDTYILEDLGSTNGTLVNGRRINESVILRPGDVVTFGSIEFRYEKVSTEAPSTQDGGQGVAGEEHVSGEPAPGAAAAENLPPVPTIFPPLDPFPAPSEATEAQAGEGVPEEQMPLQSDLAPSPSAGPDTVRQLTVESRATAERLLRLLDDLGSRLQENERMRNELEGRLRGLAAGEEARTAARHALRDVPPSSISQEQVGSLEQVLAELTEHPRDVEVLMRVGNHASVLAAAVNESRQLRAVIEKISAALEGSAPG
jgi:predicted component of type VI protein secretion system